MGQLSQGPECDLVVAAVVAEELEQMTRNVTANGGVHSGGRQKKTLEKSPSRKLFKFQVFWETFLMKAIIKR